MPNTKKPISRRRAHGLPFRSIAPMLIAALAMLTDTTILPLFYQGIYAPNVTMALVLAYSVQFGSAMGYAYATVTGLLLDISTSYPVGLYTATFLLAVTVATLCVFFRRVLGRAIVLSFIYIAQETTFLAIAYANTVRMEAAYLLPALIRVACSVTLCFVLQYILVRLLRRKGTEVVRSRHYQEVKTR